MSQSKGRPHQRTGELPRIDGARYLDSTGPLPKTSDLQKRLRADERADESSRRPRGTRIPEPLHKRPRDASGRTMGLPRIDAKQIRAEERAQTRRAQQDAQGSLRSRLGFGSRDRAADEARLRSGSDETRRLNARTARAAGAGGTGAVDRTGSTSRTAALASGARADSDRARGGSSRNRHDGVQAQTRGQARQQGHASRGAATQERTGQQRSGQGRSDRGYSTQHRADQAYANRAHANQGRPGQPDPARSGRGGKPSRQQSLPLTVMVGIGFVAVAVVLVLVAWGCSDMAAQQAQEQAQEEQAQEQTQEETLPTDLSGVTEGTYYIELSGVQSSSLVLSATGTEDADAYTVVQLGNMGYGASKQRLQLTIVDSDSCTLSTEAGLYLDVGDSTAGAGLRLYANQANDSDGQKWQIQSASGGYRIVSKSTGRAIEASSTELGAELVTDDVDDSKASQVFRFVQTNPSDSSSTSSASDSSSSGSSDTSSSSSSGTASQGSSD